MLHRTGWDADMTLTPLRNTTYRCTARERESIGPWKHSIHQLIVIGLIAHNCIEATVRYAAELGYEVAVVRDAVADYTEEMMHAALDINMPNYASAIVTTGEIVASIASLKPEGLTDSPAA
jgi:isochorismate hydrolase